LNDDDDLTVPLRPRRRILNPPTVLLFALLVGAAGFLAGVEVQKGQMTATGAAGGSGGLGRAAALAAGGGGGRAAFTGAAGGATIGQVATMSGSTLYVTDPQGNTVKVTTSGSPAVTRATTTAITVGQIHPGDTVVVQGAKAPDGSVSATSVRDTPGAGGGGLGALFGGGGGGGGTGASAGGGGGAASRALFGG
jgi:hypothetical protein